MALIVGGTTFSGSYNNLSDKPTIPTNTNQLTNGAGFITSAPAPTTSQVASATASISAGAVGSYAALGNYYNSDTKNIGDTNSGSNMFPVNFNGGSQSSTRSGTWRCMGYSSPSGEFPARQTVWLRIS